MEASASHPGAHGAMRSGAVVSRLLAAKNRCCAPSSATPIRRSLSMKTTGTRATRSNHRRKNSNSHVLQAGFRCVGVPGGLLTLPLAYADQLPPPQTQSNVPYMMGRIGKDETHAMKQDEAQFPVPL